MAGGIVGIAVLEKEWPHAWYRADDAIRISEDIYKELNRVAGHLRQQSEHPVSMDDVLEHLLKKIGLSLRDLAGAGEMTDEEAQEIFLALSGTGK